MWARLRFLAGGALQRLDRLFASWRLSVALMLVATLYDVLLAGWAATSPAQVVQNIAGLAPFWALYLLLLANTAWCLWRRLPALRRELARERRWTALGSFLFHGSFFLVALGFVSTLALREELQALVAVGEQFNGAPEQIRSWRGRSPTPSVPPELHFSVERVAPELWREQLLFTSLEASLRFPDGAERTTRINRPLWFGWGSFLRLSGFGYAPRYELLDARGQLLDTAFVKLNVFPPGARDSFAPGAYPYRVYLEVFPDLALEQGAPVSRTLNLVAPGYRVEVFRGKVLLGGAVLRAGEALEFEGLRLRFPEIRYWGEVTLVRDPGAPLLFAGYLLGLVGLAAAIRGRAGRSRASGREELR